MQINFLIFFLLYLGIAQSFSKEPKLQIYTDKYVDWSIKMHGCYNQFVPSKHSTAAGMASFDSKKCKKEFYNFSSEQFNFDKKLPFDKLIKQYAFRTGFKKMTINNTHGFLFLWDREPKSNPGPKPLRNVIWYANFFCNEKWVRIGFQEVVPSDKIDFLRRQTTLKGPSKESMKILNTFQCHKKKSKGK